MRRLPLLTLFVATALIANAQKSKTVYYFLDAMTVVKSSQGGPEQNAYIYSFPLVKTTEGQLDTDGLIKAFRQEITEKYDVTSISSLVVRTNDNFDELRAHMSRSVEKFTARQYTVIKHEDSGSSGR